MGELWAVQNDPESHGEGRFKQPAKTTVKINGKPVIVKDDDANGDNAGHSGNDVRADTTSATILCYGKKIHRNNDQRYCGAKTIVEGQTKVKCG